MGVFYLIGLIGIAVVSLIFSVLGFMGKDIVFDKMEIPFTLNPYFDLELGESYAAGTSLGITFTGDIKSGKINLTGAVIPAYGINAYIAGLIISQFVSTVLTMFYLRKYV